MNDISRRKLIFSLAAVAAVGIMGDKLLTTPAVAETSALDNINARLLLDRLNETLAVSMENVLFEFNTQETRDIVTAPVRDILKRSRIEHKVICDESNNTPAIINDSDLVVDIFIRPSMDSSYIHLNAHANLI